MRIAMIGAGVAGLTCASRLARQGFHVDVYESSDKVGGKMYQYTNDEGLSWDTGPTLISIPNEIRETFAELNFPCPELIPLTENCELIFNDGTNWKIPTGRQEIISYFNKISPKSAKQLDNIFEIAKSIYNFADKELFPNNPPALLSMGMKSVRSGFIFKNSKIAVSSYSKIIEELIEHPHLREFFYHFASYVGLLPEVAQGGILSIAHVELNSEIVFPKGGVYAIANALYNSCIENKCNFYLNSNVTLAENNTNSGNKTWKLNVQKNNEKITREYDLIVSNCDPFVAAKTWLPNSEFQTQFSQKVIEQKMKPSESQFVLLFDWEDNSNLSHHVKIFPPSWKKSFEDVTIRNEIPQDPCIYLVWPHATDKSVSPRVLFISAMAPNTTSNIDWNDNFSYSYAEKILNICREKLNLNFKGKIFKMVTPNELKNRAQSFHGGIYSAALTKHNPFYFQFSGIPKTKNLYFVGAGVHPGAGVTMVMKSARRIANHILSKYVSESKNNANI